MWGADERFIMNSPNTFSNWKKYRQRLTTLKYQRLDDLVAAIGLPKEKVCTHCWDESSYF